MLCQPCCQIGIAVCQRDGHIDGEAVNAVALDLAEGNGLGMQGLVPDLLNTLDGADDLDLELAQMEAHGGSLGGCLTGGVDLEGLAGEGLPQVGLGIPNQSGVDGVQAVDSLMLDTVVFLVELQANVVGHDGINAHTDGPCIQFAVPNGLGALGEHEVGSGIAPAVSLGGMAVLGVAQDGDQLLSNVAAIILGSFRTGLGAGQSGPLFSAQSEGLGIAQNAVDVQLQLGGDDFVQGLPGSGFPAAAFAVGTDGDSQVLSVDAQSQGAFSVRDGGQQLIAAVDLHGNIGESQNIGQVGGHAVGGGVDGTDLAADGIGAGEVDPVFLSHSLTVSGGLDQGAGVGNDTVNYQTDLGGHLAIQGQPGLSDDPGVGVVVGLDADGAGQFLLDSGTGVLAGVEDCGGQQLVAAVQLQSNAFVVGNVQQVGVDTAVVGTQVSTGNGAGYRVLAHGVDHTGDADVPLLGLGIPDQSSGDGGLGGIGQLMDNVQTVDGLGQFVEGLHVLDSVEGNDAGPQAVVVLSNLAGLDDGAVVEVPDLLVALAGEVVTDSADERLAGIDVGHGGSLGSNIHRCAGNGVHLQLFSVIPFFCFCVPDELNGDFFREFVDISVVGVFACNVIPIGFFYFFPESLESHGNIAEIFAVFFVDIAYGVICSRKCRRAIAQGIVCVFAHDVEKRNIIRTGRSLGSHGLLGLCGNNVLQADGLVVLIDPAAVGVSNSAVGAVAGLLAVAGGGLLAVPAIHEPVLGADGEAELDAGHTVALCHDVVTGIGSGVAENSAAVDGQGVVALGTGDLGADTAAAAAGHVGAAVGTVAVNGAATDGCVVGKHAAAQTAVGAGAGNGVAGNDAAGHVQERGSAHEDAAALGSAVVTGNGAAHEIQGAALAVQLDAALTAGDLTGVVAAGVLDGKDTAGRTFGAEVDHHSDGTAVTGDGVAVQVQGDIQGRSGVLQVLGDTGGIAQQGDHISATVGIVAGSKTVECGLQALVAGFVAFAVNDLDDVGSGNSCGFYFRFRLRGLFRLLNLFGRFGFVDNDVLRFYHRLLRIGTGFFGQGRQGSRGEQHHNAQNHCQ